MRAIALFSLLFVTSAAVAEPIAQAPALELSVGNRLVHRELTFVDDLFHVLPAYTLPVGSMPTATLELWPAAFAMKDGIARNFGLSASFGELVGVQAVVENSIAPPRRTYGTDFDVALLARVLLGPATLVASGGYSSSLFAFDPPDDTDTPTVPNVRYASLRAALRARVRVADPVELEFGGGYRFLLGQDAFGVDALDVAYFPRATGGGAEASLGVLVGLPGGFELRVHGDWQRHFFSLNPEVGDKYVAGGALDERFAGRASVAFRL